MEWKVKTVVHSNKLQKGFPSLIWKWDSNLEQPHKGEQHYNTKHTKCYTFYKAHPNKDHNEPKVLGFIIIYNYRQIYQDYSPQWSLNS